MEPTSVSGSRFVTILPLVSEAESGDFLPPPASLPADSVACWDGFWPRAGRDDLAFAGLQPSRIHLGHCFGFSVEDAPDSVMESALRPDCGVPGQFAIPSYKEMMLVHELGCPPSYSSLLSEELKDCECPAHLPMARDGCGPSLLA